MAYIPFLHNLLYCLSILGSLYTRTLVTSHLYCQFWGLLSWNLWASCIFWGRIITHFAWMVHRLVSSNKPTRYASVASCRVPMVIPWNCMSDLKSWAIFQTSCLKGSLLMRSSVIFWYLQISLSAMVPGLNWNGWKLALVLGMCLPPCEGDFYPCVILLGPAAPSVYSSSKHKPKHKSFRLLVPRRLETHHCSPSCHCQLGLPLLRGGTGHQTLGCGSWDGVTLNSKSKGDQSHPLEK